MTDGFVALNDALNSLHFFDAIEHCRFAHTEIDHHFDRVVAGQIFLDGPNISERFGTVGQELNRIDPRR